MLQYRVVVAYNGIDDGVKCDDLFSAVEIVNKVIDGTATWLQPGWYEARIEVNHEDEQPRVVFRVSAPTAKHVAIFADLRQVEDRLIEGGPLGQYGKPLTVKIVAGGVWFAVLALGSLGTAIAGLMAVFVCLAG